MVDTHLQVTTPLSTIDWFNENRFVLLAATVVLVVVWTAVPYWMAVRWRPSTRAERDAAADRYRGLISRIIAVPLVAVPLLAYVDGYLKQRQDDAKEKEVRFEDRFRQSAMLIDSKTAITQLMGLQAMQRLVDGADATRAKPILEALASSIVDVSPLSKCSTEGIRVASSAQMILNLLVERYVDGMRTTIRDACLRGVSIITNKDLTRLDFANSDLDGSDLYEISVDEWNLRFAVLSGVSMPGAHLNNVGMHCTAAEPARSLAVADLMSNGKVPFNSSRAVLSNFKVTHSYFPEADFSNSRFAGGKIESSCMAAADLYRANFDGVTLQDVRFDRLNGAGLIFHSNATRVSFDGANLVSADFTNATLNTVSFRGANLSDADFTGAKLRSSSFDGAIICNTKDPEGKLLAPAQDCGVNDPGKLRDVSPDRCVLEQKAFCSAAVNDLAAATQGRVLKY